MPLRGVGKPKARSRHGIKKGSKTGKGKAGEKGKSGGGLRESALQVRRETEHEQDLVDFLLSPSRSTRLARRRRAAVASALRGRPPAEADPAGYVHPSGGRRRQRPRAPKNTTQAVMARQGERRVSMLSDVSGGELSGLDLGLGYGSMDGLVGGTGGAGPRSGASASSGMSLKEQVRELVEEVRLLREENESLRTALTARDALEPRTTLTTTAAEIEQVRARRSSRRPSIETQQQ